MAAKDTFRPPEDRSTIGWEDAHTAVSLEIKED
jgi:hypothetical protein